MSVRNGVAYHSGKTSNSKTGSEKERVTLDTVITASVNGGDEQPLSIRDVLALMDKGDQVQADVEGAKTLFTLLTNGKGKVTVNNEA